MGGGGKGKQTPSTSPYEATNAAIAEQTFRETDPLRQGLLADMTKFVQGGYNPKTDPRFAPMYDTAKYGAEKQYGVARENILANTPRGGGQVDALSGLESDRAAQVGQISNVITTNLINDLLAKTYGVAFNAPQQSMAGLGAAGASYAGRYGAANQAYSAQQKNWMDLGTNMGQGIGAMMGGK